MGDRANIFVVDPYGPPLADADQFSGVYLYTHWAGSEIEKIARQAIDSPAGRGRWSEGSYLTRIIFDVMTADAYSKETGYGVSTSPPDNSHDIIVVHPGIEAVRLAPEGTERDKDAEDWTPFQQFTERGFA